jgi:hypothetical protein
MRLYSTGCVILQDLTAGVLIRVHFEARSVVRSGALRHIVIT